MASIDKIYCTKEEYIQGRNFWIETYDEQIRLFGEAHWLYPFSAFDDILPKGAKITPEFLKEHLDDVDYYEGAEDFPMWNTSTIFDIWLSKNCSLDFVQGRLKSVYGRDWFGFKYKNKLDFTNKPTILSIEYNNQTIYLFKNVKDSEDLIETLDKVIVYGTTYFLKVFNSGINNISTFNYLKGTKTKIDLFGIILTVLDGQFYNEEGDLISVGFINDPRHYFEIPKIKYSFNKKEIKEYSEEEIYFSNENEITALTDYKDFSKEKLNRYLLSEIPEYIRDIIK